MLPIDRYAYTNGIADLDPIIKLAVCGATIIVSMVFESYVLNWLLFTVMVVVTTIVARVPLIFYLKVLMVPMVFLVMGFIGIVISVSTMEVFTWSIGIGSYNFGITMESYELGLLTVSRSAAAISGTLFLALTTSADSILRKVWKYPIPKVLLEIAILTYRSIFIFLEEASVMHQAQAMRHGHDGIEKSFLSWSLLVKEIFTRVLKRYEAMIVSLETRNYNGQFKMGD